MFKYNLCQECRYGRMIYNVLDQYVGQSLHQYGEFSQGEAIVFDQLVHAGDVVVEAGANIGAHTVHLAQLVGEQGRVYAFEPQRLVFQTLCGNLALNSLTNVFASQQALGNQPGTIKVPCLDVHVFQNWGGLSLVHSTQGEPVPVTTIDNLQLTACRLIKVDVEGMEQQVLQGAQKTIASCRPYLYVEINMDDKISKPLVDYMKSLGYRVYKHTPSLFNKDNYFHKQENTFIKQELDDKKQPRAVVVSSFNALCVPRETKAKVVDMREFK